MKRLKYFAIYAVGLALFDIAATYAFDISWTVPHIVWLGVVYFIANMVGYIERGARFEDLV